MLSNIADENCLAYASAGGSSATACSARLLSTAVSNGVPADEAAGDEAGDEPLVAGARQDRVAAPDPERVIARAARRAAAAAARPGNTAATTSASASGGSRCSHFWVR